MPVVSFDYIEKHEQMATEITALRAVNDALSEQIMTMIDNAGKVAALRAENERLRAALTPSAETKAAYWGEFYFIEEHMDDDGEMIPCKITVPWTTIKEIMAAIRARTALILPLTDKT